MRCLLWIVFGVCLIACAQESPKSTSAQDEQQPMPTVALTDLEDGTWPITEVRSDGTILFNGEVVLEATATNVEPLDLALVTWIVGAPPTSTEGGVVCYPVRDPKRPSLLKSAPDAPASRAMLALRSLQRHEGNRTVLLALPLGSEDPRAFPIHFPFGPAEQRTSTPRRVARVDWFNAPSAPKTYEEGRREARRPSRAPAPQPADFRVTD